MTKSTTTNHLRALTKKNYILWKRNPCCSVFEILLPCLLSSILFIMRGSIDRTDIPEKGYAIDTLYKFNLFNSSILPLIKRCENNTYEDFPSFRNGHVALAPNNFYTQSLYSLLLSYNYIVKMYPSKQDIFDYTLSENYNEDVCFGITFDEASNGQYKYSLLFNTTESGDGIIPEVPDTIWDEQISYKVESNSTFFMPWVQNGFLTLQQYIDNLIIREETGNPFIVVASNLASEKLPEHAQDEIQSILKGQLALFLVLPLILPYLRLTYGLLIEKEKKIREGMKIMGMSNTAFYLSWILYYLVIFTIISLLQAAILQASIYQNTEITILFLVQLIFCISLIFQGIFITSFFTKAKVGNIFAMLWYLLNYIIFGIMQDSNIQMETKMAASFSTLTGYSFASDVFLLIEAESQGIDWSSLNRTINNYSIATFFIITLINILIFLVLSIYFDQVIPNEFGKKKHPLFFLNCLYKFKSEKLQNQDKEKNNDNQDLSNKNNIEAVDIQLLEQEQTDRVLKMQNLSKTYSNGKVAVKDLSLTMYNGQIFVLLGHNGAGKTTTISMLTGMIEFSMGEAVVFGKNVQTDMEDIRSQMGVCPQHDILFDDLTVREHLELFAVFKGMDSSKINAVVEKAITDVDLQEKADDFAKNLSGGQRRRLSVAIAFIGDSKLIYLDEPTSGMDTSARRHIWEMLKKYKNDKIVVLTTHFMDEADFLGDRIGIMGEGQLICCGSSVFLKNTFGVGYNLTIVKKDITENSQPIIDYIQSIIPQSHILSNVSAEISLQLPMDSLNNFSTLFKGIDEKMSLLKIQSYGISITTLEEVFLRVADLQQLKNKEIDQKEKPLEINVEQQINKQPLLEEIDNFDLNSVRIKGFCSLFLTHIMACIMKRIWFFKRDKKGLFCEIFLPCIIVIVGLSILLINFDIDSPALILSSSLFPQPQQVIYSGDQASNSASKANMDALLSYFDSNQFDFEYFASSSLIDLDNYHYEKRSLDRRGSYFINSIKPQQFEYTAIVQTITKDIAPYMVNRMNTAILRKLTNKKSSNIEVTVHPFPLTQNTKKITAQYKAINAAFGFSMALAFIPASIITFIVKERNDNIKHQQLVSGISLISYWLSNYLMDIIKHLIPAVFCILMVFAYNIQAFTGENLGPIALLLILYGWSVIPFTYLFSFLFQDHGNAQVASFFFHFLIGSICPLIVFILRIIESTREAGKIVGWIFRCIPSFSFGSGILNIGAKKTYALFEMRKDVPDAYELDIAGGDLIAMAIEGIFYLLLIFVLEMVQNMPSIIQIFTREQTVPYQTKPLDDDVFREEIKVQKQSPSEFAVHIDQLRKVFIPEGRIKIAVDKVSFGIANGECFTLLGVNGAGKTTTFKMLTGEINPTSGHAHIMGFDIRQQQKKARSQIGYCPQFDALLENLTAREHLMMYAAIKGIPSKLRSQLVDKKLIEMDLLKFEKVPAGTLSGGNKRKLSVAIAMLGNPPVVLLDEPSTGMDPKARRFMWNVISRISTKRKQSSVILTTHSMEEAEALSTQLAIQVDGRLQCYGSVQHIKSKFGEGYEVEVKVNVPSQEKINERITQAQIMLDKINDKQVNDILLRLKGEKFLDSISEDGFGSALYQQFKQQKQIDIKTLVSFVIVEENGEEIMQFIQNNLGNFELIEHFSTFFRFRIISKISIGMVFGFFENNKELLNIIQYSVKQPTIEQIFNLFAQGKIGGSLQQKKSIIKINLQNDNINYGQLQQDIQIKDLNLAINNYK